MDALTFIQQLYDNNSIAGSVDGWSIHTYNGAIPGKYTDGLAFQQATQLPVAVATRGDTGAARIWITDSGTSTCGASIDYHLSDEFAWADESEQSAWLTNQWTPFQSVPGHGLFVWHDLRDGAPYPSGYTGTKATASPSTLWPADNTFFFGLIHSDFSAKPGLASLSTLAGGARTNLDSLVVVNTVTCTSTVVDVTLSAVSPLPADATPSFTMAAAQSTVVHPLTQSNSVSFPVTTSNAVSEVGNSPVVVNNPATVTPTTFDATPSFPDITYEQGVPVDSQDLTASFDPVGIAITGASSVSIQVNTITATASVYDWLSSLDIVAAFPEFDAVATIPTPLIVTTASDIVTVTSRPTLTGVMIESPDYRTLGVGLTDRLFLLGHGDGIPINDPYQVTSVQDGINHLNGDPASPLLRAMIEAYYSGARDIYLVRVAPMYEYVEDVTQRLTPGSGRGPINWGEDDGELHIESQFAAANAARAQRGLPPLPVPTAFDWDNFNFYERYQARLDVAYELLIDWDTPQIIVPVQAVYYDAGGVDFLGQLTAHCSAALDVTGAVRIGMLGTRYDHLSVDDRTAYQQMATDFRIELQSNEGKFVSVIVGEGVFNLKEFPTMYSTPLVVAAAGLLSTLPVNRGLTYEKLPNVLGIVGTDLTKDEAIALTNSKLNPCARVGQGRRGQPFNVAVLTDNTLGTTGTDYWSLVQLRLIARCVDRIRGFGLSSIGTVGIAQFKQNVQTYLNGLVQNNLIRGFNYNIVQDVNDRNTLLVDVDLQPFFGLRNLTFSTTVGPGL